MKNKPRNHVVLAMMKSSKNAGVHQKSVKAKRQSEKIALKKSIANNKDSSFYI